MKIRFTIILILCTYSFMLSGQIQFDLEVITKKYLKNEFAVSGLVLDLETGEPILFASVVLYTKDGVPLGGTETDLDGRYSLQNIKAGSYSIETSFIGYTPTRLIGVDISRSILDLDIEIKEKVIMCGLFCPSFRKPLIRLDDTTSGMIMTASEIRHMR